MNDDMEIVSPLTLLVESPIMVHCARCDQTKQRSNADQHLCADCAAAENARYNYYRQHQGDWIAEAKEQGIDPWLVQPGETQWEYSIWCAYRDSYPGKKPNYADVAQQLKTTYRVVKGVAQRWSFTSRMQLWVNECDRFTMLQRKDEILAMNKSHLTMAAKLRAKLDSAIDAMRPEEMKASEIASLAKVMVEMERKAQTDSETQEVIRQTLIVDNNNPELKKNQTKQGDLEEVIGILAKAGVLGNITSLGVKETTTTTREVVARDDSGASASMIEEDT